VRGRDADHDSAGAAAPNLGARQVRQKVESANVSLLLQASDLERDWESFALCVGRIAHVLRQVEGCLANGQRVGIACIGALWHLDFKCVFLQPRGPGC
jgi:hypothetical protein